MQSRQRKRGETLRNRQAFEIYVALGKGRSCAEVARQIGSTAQEVQRWAQLFKWKERVVELEKQGVIDPTVAVDKSTIASGLPELHEDNDMSRRVRKSIDFLEDIIDDAIAKPNIVQITGTHSLIQVMKEYREMVDLYHKLTSSTRGGGGGGQKKDGRIADALTVVFNNMNQEERIELLKGRGGAEHSAGGGAERAVEADYQEVPERGDEHDGGCEGVSDSAERAGGGDEG